MREQSRGTNFFCGVRVFFTNSFFCVFFEHSFYGGSCGGISDGSFSRWQKGCHPYMFSTGPARPMEYRHMDMLSNLRSRGKGGMQRCSPAWSQNWHWCDRMVKAKHSVTYLVHFHACALRTQNSCFVKVETLPEKVEPSPFQQSKERGNLCWGKRLLSFLKLTPFNLKMAVSLLMFCFVFDPCFDTSMCHRLTTNLSG